MINMISQSRPFLLHKLQFVSSKFHALSLEAWRSSVSVRIGYRFGKLYVTKQVQRSCSSSATPFETFLNYLEDPEHQCMSKPFRHYQFHYFGPFHSVHAEQLERFWNLTGEHIISLKLSQCSIPSLDEIKEITSNRCPNLEQLTFRYCRFVLPTEEQFGGLEYAEPEFGRVSKLSSIHIEFDKFQDINSDWMELISNFNSVDALTVSVSKFVIGSRYQRPSEALETIRLIKVHGVLNMQISELNFHPSFDVSQEGPEFPLLLEVLQELQLPLRSFNARLNPDEMLQINEFRPAPEIDWLGLRKIGYHASFLQPALWRYPFTQQPLTNLKILVMSNVLWPNMEFLRYTPNLGKLAILYEDIWEDLLFIGKLKSTTIVANTCKASMADLNLWTLDTFIMDFLVSEDDLTYLMGWFPKVRKLRMILTNEQFTMICQQWKGIEELEVMGNELTDGGVTGLVNLDQESPNGNVGMGRFSSLLNFRSPTPPVALLPNLTKLTCMSWNLTEASIFHGFTKMPSLRHLTLHVHVFPSDRAKRALEKAGVHLSRVYHITADSDLED